jgi:hypothetical protein
MRLTAFGVALSVLWQGSCLAQSLGQVCQMESANLDAATRALLTQKCARLTQCDAQCGGSGNVACIRTCLSPGEEAETGSASRSSGSPFDEATAKLQRKSDEALCRQAQSFRDQQLFTLWDTEQKKYEILTEGSDAMKRLRTETTRLLDENFWAGSTGATVAIEIKGFTDVLNDVIQLFLPEAQLGTAVFHNAEDIASTVTGIDILVTYSKEDAKAAALQSMREVSARYGGQVGAAAKLLGDVADYAKNKKEAQEYEQTVQDQVQRANQAIRMLKEKRKDAIRNMDGYQEVVRGIDLLCASHVSPAN